MPGVRHQHVALDALVLHLDIRCHPVQPGIINICQQQAGTALGHAVGQRFTNARGGAGDDHGFVLEGAHVQ